MGDLAIDYLAGRGHRRVLVLMPQSGDEARYRAARLRGAQRSAERHRVLLHVECTDLDIDSMGGAIVRGMKRKPHPTAIYAFNDEYARAAQGSLCDLGIDVPGDVALLGCDDGPLASYGWPRLSSIAVSSPERWKNLARAVHSVIVGQPVNDLTPPATLRVVERQTT